MEHSCSVTVITVKFRTDNIDIIVIVYKQKVVFSSMVLQNGFPNIARNTSGDKNNWYKRNENCWNNSSFENKLVIQRKMIHLEENTQHRIMFTRNTSVLSLQVTSQILRTRSRFFRDRCGDHYLTRWPPRTGFVVQSAKSSPNVSIWFKKEELKGGNEK